MDSDRIFLVGLSGSGKSTVARLIADELGWEAVDTDDLIAAVAGKPVERIFAEEGEADFRRREVRVLEKTSQGHQIVVATGGGAPLTADGRAAIGSGFVVWLQVAPETAASRLLANPGSETRPLLQGGDPRTRLEAMLETRGPLYRQLASCTIPADRAAPAEVADEVIRCWRAATGGTSGGPPAAVVRTPTATYPVIVRESALAELGDVCRQADLTGRAFVITDDRVADLWAGQAVRALEQAQFSAPVVTIPSGEEHKNLATLERVYDQLLEARVERSDFAVCLGGGVVTDLAGFAAATCLRGIPFVHVPTTLLGMVDAAIGGKLAVDHPRGKNMIGVFAQPRAVVIDPLVLATLPERQVHAGCAELIKHGLILDERLVEDLEAARGPAAATSADLIARSVAIKAAIVSEDERESARRTLLNYGHTVGHAIEAVTSYRTYLHGEAVAIGMQAAARISVEMGLLEEPGFERQAALLQAFGLPLAAPGLEPEAVLNATLGDKKVRDGKVRWVLLEKIGRAAVHDDVPDALARRAVEAITA
jgi:3-dehydroquinate synthase